MPQRSRRLSASGISQAHRRLRGLHLRLKEADAFQRLVYYRVRHDGTPTSRLKEADAFQRLVWLIHPRERSGLGGLKEADAFQRLV